MSKIKKIFDRKRPQLRRCAFCDKSGHNKSTCEKFQASLIIPKSSSPAFTPIKFFVHHVTTTPTHSPHVVNLKKQPDSALDRIQSVGPQSHQSDFEDAYKKIKESSSPKISYPITLEPAIEQPEEESPAFNKFTTEKLFRPLNSQITIPKNIISVPKIKQENKLLKVKQSWKNWETKTAQHLEDATKDFGGWMKTNLILQKTAVSLAVLAIILVLPGKANSYYQDVQLTKNKIASDSTNGFMSLQNSTAALMQSNLPTAQMAIDEALNSFGNAVETMQTKHQVLQKIVSVIPVMENEVKSRQNLLLAGQKIALGNTYLLKGIGESQTNVSSTLEERMNVVMDHLHAAIPNYQAAMDDLSGVDETALPLAYQAPFKDFKNVFGAVLSDLKNLSDLGGSLKEIFGARGQRRYLLVFQNPAELRPTGGFMGSFAILDVKDGKILNLEVPPGGTYDLQGQLDQYVIPPTPLLLTNKRWEFQDSNWFPDFSVSAQKILWFYRHSRNITADGVIAINASVLERLLAITGPISDTKRGLTISAQSALPTIQKVVESGPEKDAHKPKQILSDLAPQFIEHFQNSQPKDLIPLLTNLQDALSKKEIQAYFIDQTAQNATEQMGWAGKILPTNSNQDYLAVFNTNIHGQKSDAKINQTISHQAIVENDGTISDTVIITRTHTGTDQEEMYGAPNIDYIRVYVPRGSELISANGFTWPDEANFHVPENYYKTDDLLSQTEKEIKIDERTGTRVTEEFNKTAFGNWVITTPGQTTQIQFTYRLPFKIDNISSGGQDIWQKFLSNKKISPYQLVVQKQSGIDSGFESQIILPANYQVSHQQGENIQVAQNGASITNFNLDT
ncbi:MAG: DUF4012 domain-containing protein, partial [Candidatus Magasanikbacteria bacterium]|nr:DUF4012 domain-containing protein [Candidatus Magasanikbacteria bacterium]